MNCPLFGNLRLSIVRLVSAGFLVDFLKHGLVRQRPDKQPVLGGVTELKAIGGATMPRKHEIARFVQLFRITRLTVAAI